MGTIKEKFTYLEDTKLQIRNSLSKMGITVNDKDTFRSYADKIMNIHTAFEVPQGLVFTNSKVSQMPPIDTSGLTDMTSLFENCTELTCSPEMDCTNSQSMHRTFYGCSKLKTVRAMDTFNVMNMDGMFGNCPMLNRIEGIDFGSLETNDGMLTNSDNIVYMDIKNLGITPFIYRYDFSNLSNWGNSNMIPDARTSLMNTLNNNIFDRKANGMLETVTIVLHKNVNAMLNQKIRDELTRKGYVIETA